jgi:multidrug efflux system outer membrane protein
MRRPSLLHRPATPGSWGLIALLALGGCSFIPPKAAPPRLREQAPLALAPIDATIDAPGSWPAAEWWRLYQDPDLNALIERARRGSPSLAAAQARFASAQASVRTAAALLGVQVSADGDISTQRLSDTGLIPPQFLGYHWYDQTDLGLNVRYSFDWWGKQRAQINAALDDAHAAVADQSSAGLVLATSVAQTYFAWAADTARGALARERLRNLQRQSELAGARVGAQIARVDETVQIQGSITQAAEQITTLANSAQLHLVALAALLAVSPDELPPLHARPLPALQARLPADVGLDLMARRADIVASRWRVEAAMRGVEVARAGYLPDVSLQALAGFSSIHPAKLLDLGSSVPEVGAAIHLPLFDSGRLRGAYEGSSAQLRSAIATYDDTVVSAAREVGTQAITRADLLARRPERVRAVDLAAALERTAAARAAAGITDARPELTAGAQRLDTQDQLLQLDAEALQTDLDLIRALGGGYQSTDFHDAATTSAVTTSKDGTTP